MEESIQKKKRIIIVGAGPAGLLAAIFLCRRGKYEVTLLDQGIDYSKVNDLSAKRSWMVCLSAHGLSAVKQIPQLYKHYIEGLGVHVKRVLVAIGSKIKFSRNLKAEGAESFFTVDRNYICAALSKYLNENHDYDAKYETRALFVDTDKKAIVVRDSASTYSIGYDVVLGCDGVRSIVRNAFVSCHRDFEFDLKGTFSISKSAHIPLPEHMEEGTFLIQYGTLLGATAFGLPETGRMCNWNIGIPMHKSLAPELYSTDVNIVEGYFRQNLKIGDGWDFTLLAQEWVTQKFNTTQQTHCNFYHSKKVSGIILGDAAHACLPVLGQGMNTALADVAAMDKLLDKHNDDWDKVLPEFSEERVKEGNALTDLSFYNLSCSNAQQINLMLGSMTRLVLNQVVPAWLVTPNPILGIPKGMKLSEAYNTMMKLGAIEPVRKVNDKVVRDFFEREVGMVKDEPRSYKYWKPIILLIVVGATVAVF